MEIKISEVAGLWNLSITSKNKNSLEQLKEIIQDMFMRCDNCKGEITSSDGQYLCLSGCGHVDGEQRD